ncbi:MAG: phosphate acyltransferase PlsX [Ginsengibacter sp.]
MTIAIDMMGGDFAPQEAFKGVEFYLQNASEKAHLLLVGDETILNDGLKKYHFRKDLITIVHAPEVIEMHEHPTKALKEKPQSSIGVGFFQLATGKADAFISAGNTGAMMVGSLFTIKAIDGILRPTIGGYLPRENGSLGLLVDVGLNSDCKPENLLQFSILGSLYAKHVLGFDNPKVGLVNIGEEESKGNLLTQAAHQLLKESASINFVGNIEGRDILLDKADVVVCEGFTGNVLLKFAESIHDLVNRRKIVDEHFERFNFEIYGGVPVLGINKPVIIGHGISHAVAFENMIHTASKMFTTSLIDKIRSSFAEV